VQEEPDKAADAEAARDALRDGLERARELLCEAKYVIGRNQPAPDASEDKIEKA
jgi:hypothetical protein